MKNYYNNIRAPSKSSLSSSPHYTTTYTRASNTTTSLVGEHIVTTAPPSTVGSSLGESTTTSAFNIDDGFKIYNNNNNNYSGGGGVTHPSQIMFCPGLHDDVVATINCAPSSTKNKTKSNSRQLPRSDSGGSISSNGSTGKLNEKKMLSTTGPIMLELRRVELSKSNPNGGDNDDGGGGEFFTTRTVALSRGLPSLGLSVASTCLDLPSSTIVNNYDSSGNTLIAASGSSTGALCIHKFNTIEKSTATILSDSNIDMDNKISNDDIVDEDLFLASPVEYFHTLRHHRKASAVAWRPSIQTNHVAIGLVGTNTTVSGTKNHSNHHLHHKPHRRGGPISMRASASDREYCCFLWDIVDSKKTTMPLSKFSYNSPVASLAWMMDGQTLAVGGQQRTIQLYDLRMSTYDSRKLAPLSAFAHESGVHGIELHPHRPNLMATFCRTVGEPVKLFDIRRMDSVVSEIRLTSNDISTSGVGSTSTTSMGTTSMQRNQHVKAEAIQWSILESGMLSVATGESVQEYDTNSGSRPSLVRVSRVSKAGKTIKAIAFYRGKERITQQNDDSVVSIDVDGKSNTMMLQERKESKGNILDNQKYRSNKLLPLLYPQRMLAVLEDQTIVDMAKDTNAPLAISRRDGRIVHALGPHLFMGRSNEGPSAMEKNMKKKGNEMQQDDEDISATMVRRARCLQTNQYSMNPELNIKLLSREIEGEEDIDRYRSSLLPKYSNRALLRLWGWIERVESLSYQEVDDTDEDLRTAKPLLNAGVIQILGMNTQNYDGNDMVDEQTNFSETFACNIYDSPSRRAALSSCGWAGKFDLAKVMTECEALGEHERSAALAVWHEDVGAAVEALQRASELIRLQSREREGKEDSVLTTRLQYAETLDLMSMCIAGYGGKTESQRGVWRRACSSLLLRDDLSSTRAKHSGLAYLRALSEFLMNAGTIESLVKILENSHLSLCDRVAFACRFLEKKELMTYLLRLVDISQNEGDLEGLAITSLSKPGIKILQSFVDKYTDVQTAALVVSRIILPSDWTIERKICFEWVESYRSLLNYWQMWETRAVFDVDRAEVLRRVKARSGGGSHQRRLPNSRMRQSPRPPDPDILPCIPAQLEARCNYCSSPLSLKRQEGIANQWLSKMQPLLNCCPQCRKPLPSCSICLLSMGSLNPYMELTRARQGPRGTNFASADDLSSLSSMNFAEWYTWCMRCRHGGHAHHILGWFSTQKTCPVSGCDCECEFDGAIKLNRPVICVDAEK